MAWQAGDKVGPYRIEGQIGQGGMATVYKGYHESLDRHVAIKVMHSNFLDDETFVTRFTREARIVAGLSHPHIVPIYDYEERNGVPYLVMKYIPGMTLKKRIIKSPPTLEEVMDIMSAVGSALSYAHKMGILHRDVKPSNIVIDTNDVPYLTDFGLARLASSGESTMSADTLLGTPHYLSPEQARGDKELDRRTDIYSFGVVLYELLVGTVPFTADTPFAIIHDHIYKPVPPPREINPTIPTEVAEVLEKALEKDAADRYATVDELIADLGQAIASANLTSLDDDRMSVASQSLAAYRSSVFQAAPVATPAIPAVIDTGSSYQKAKLIPAKPWYKRETIWPIGGCASFLIIVFLGLGVVLSASATILELVSLTDTAQRLTLPDPQFGRFGVEFNEFPYPHYETPADIPSVEATIALNTFRNEPLAYLIAAAAEWQQGDSETARQQIASGYPFSEEPVYYLTNAAEIAQQEGDRQAAVIFAILAMDMAQDNPALWDRIRSATGEILYVSAGSFDARGANALSQTIIENLPENYEGTTLFNDLPGVQFVSIKALLDNDNLALARNRLRVANRTGLETEYSLLAAELLWDSGNPEDALLVLEGILEMDPPEWIEDQAEELFDSITE